MTFSLFGKDVSASKAINHVGDELDRTGRKSEGFGKKFAKFGAIAASGIAAAGAAAIGVGVVSVKAAIEDEASQSRLAQTLRKTQGARKADTAGVEKWIDTTSRASGVADDELRPALSNLLIAGESVADSQKDVALAMDVAQAKGLDLNAVTKAMAKAHNGNVGALGRLGIATKDASGKTLTYKEIQEKLAKQMGGATAAAAETTQGKMKRLGVAFQETKEAIGAKLLPVLLKVGDWILNTGIPAISKFWGWFKEKILPVLKELAGKVMEGVRNGFKSISDAIERNRPQLQKLWEGFKKVADFIVTKVAPLYAKYLKFLFERIGDGIGFVIDTIGFLIDMAPKVINNFIRPVVGAFLSFASLIVGAAATAFGWVPGLGPKLKAAKEKIDKFKTDADLAMAKMAESMNKSGEKVGENLNKGLARGIKNSSGLPKAEAQRVADSVKAKFSGPRGFDTKSPSRWAHKIGSYVNQGFANGLGENDPFTQANRLVSSGGVGRAAGRGAVVENHYHVHAQIVRSDRDGADVVRGWQRAAAAVGVG